MEIQRVATLMKNKCADLGKNASRDDVSRVYAKTFEEEWVGYPQRRQVETMKWKRRIRYQTYRLNSCSNSAERRRTQANARNDHPF
jgi:hypothetical protein